MYIFFYSLVIGEKLKEITIQDFEQEKPIKEYDDFPMYMGYFFRDSYR